MSGVRYLWILFEHQLWQVGIVVGEISLRQMCSVHERTQKHTQTQEERPLGKMLRGVMKLHLIKFALWSLQSRDEGVDKDKARRLRGQGRRHGSRKLETEGWILKMRVNSRGMKDGRVSG